MTGRIKICLACSHGGHLTEMRHLEPAFVGHEVFYFCYDAATTRELERAYRVPNMARNPIELIKNLFRVTRIFWKERPDLIVSTGAEIAIPVVLVGKLFRVPSVYIECGAQVTQPSFTGRIMSRLASAFYVQWPELLSAYNGRAQLRGSFIDAATPFTGDRSQEGRAMVALILRRELCEADVRQAALLAAVLQRAGIVVRMIDNRAELLASDDVDRLLECMRPDTAVWIHGPNHHDDSRAYGLHLDFGRHDLESALNQIAEPLGLEIDAIAHLDPEGLVPDWPLLPRRKPTP
jgi:beta-1,4-N-acetylglucosaminyltransferase